MTDTASIRASCPVRPTTQELAEAIKALVLPDAGHWLHADDPEGLASWLAERL